MSLLDQIRTMQRAKQGQGQPQAGVQSQPSGGSPVEEALARFMETIGKAGGLQGNGNPNAGVMAGRNPGGVPRPGGRPQQGRPQQPPVGQPLRAGQGRLPQPGQPGAGGARLASVFAGRGGQPRI